MVFRNIYDLSFTGMEQWVVTRCSEITLCTLLCCVVKYFKLFIIRKITSGLFRDVQTTFVVVVVVNVSKFSTEKSLVAASREVPW